MRPKWLVGIVSAVLLIAGSLMPGVQKEQLPDPLDPLVAAPGFHKLVVENEKVRVLDVQVKPGEFEPLHKHPQSVIVILQGGKVRFGLPDGSNQEVSFSPNPDSGEQQPPQVFWTGPEIHSVKNIGNTAVRLIRVEIK